MYNLFSLRDQGEIKKVFKAMFGLVVYGGMEWNGMV
jgi:hypothetical protein